MEIKIKSHNFAFCNLGFFFTFILIVCGTLMLCLSTNRTVFLWAVSFVFPVAFVIFTLSIVFRFYTKTYDIFSNEGVRREHAGEIICSVSWENVKSISYRSSVLWIPLLPFESAFSLSVESLHVLRLDFVNPIRYTDSCEPRWGSHEFRPDNKNVFFTYVSKRNIKKIAPFFPDGIMKKVPKYLKAKQ